MKILVTGTAGFIGSHLARALINEGHEVVGLDNFNAYYQVSLKRARHSTLEGLAGYTGIEGDICDRSLVEGLFSSNSFDGVCHLAAQAGVRYSLENPYAYQKANIEGFLNVLEACRHSKVSRLVYASSSSVYGGNTKLPFSEDDPVNTPISLYAATKRCDELMAHTYGHLYGLQTIGLRFFTVYGPWGRPDMALWLFTEAMSAGRPIKVFNHGNMERDFTYIDDIIHGVLRALQADGLDKTEIFNLGNSRTERLGDLIQVLAETMGVEPVKEMYPMQPGDVLATYADVSRARKKLGYKPATKIQVGIPKFVHWYREYTEAS
jgi:UDP-glucuronate 4-epimerase